MDVAHTGLKGFGRSALKKRGDVANIDLQDHTGLKEFGTSTLQQKGRGSSVQLRIQGGHQPAFWREVVMSLTRSVARAIETVHSA